METLQDFGYFTTSTSSLPEPTGAGETASITITGISSGTLLYSTSEKLDIEDFSFEIGIVTEKRINYERFLGLWKNSKGEYEQGLEFDPNGKEVPYPLPDEEDAKIYPPEEIASENGQDISLLISLLQNYDDTQLHERLMKYYWNVWMGEEIWDVDLGEILDFFDTEVFKPIGGGSIYGGNAEEKVWYALIEAGFSEYAAAGAMGSIYQESGFRTNNLQNTYETSLGLSDEQYTAAVDNGSYANFANDWAGYGLCQWTSPGRKTGLLNYVKDKGVSISDTNAQVEYLLAELGVSNSAAGNATYQLLRYHGYDADAWINATNVSDAATAFCWSFERPDDKYANVPNRIQKANEYYNKYHGKKRPAFSGDTVQGGSFTFPHYLQGNYANISYGPGGRTVSSSGCGPTSLAMILSGVLGDPSIDPASVVADIKTQWPNGEYFQVPDGSSHCIFQNSFLQKYYGVHSTYIRHSPNERKLGLEALENGYPVIGGEQGHVLALIPVSDELKAQGYKFYIMDSARGHDGPYKSVEDANKVVKGSLTFTAIIKP